MKIKAAIKVLDNILSRLAIYEEPDDRKAIELGIEALKRLQEHRNHHIDIFFRALPGETVD